MSAADIKREIAKRSLAATVAENERMKERTTQYYACEHGIPGGCQFCNATRHQTLEAERDLLKSQVAELAEALRSMTSGLSDHLKHGKLECPSCADEVEQARAILLKVRP